jgi:hypothetical protein
MPTDASIQRETRRRIGHWVRNLGQRDCTMAESLVTTPVFESFWRFAAERQRIMWQRVRGAQPPWTHDPILRTFRFTNAYRAADRVSQYLIRHVIYDGNWSAEDTVFRVLLFKIFNRIETWDSLNARFGPLSACRFEPDRFSEHLSRLQRSGRPIYSGAYLMPSAREAFGSPRKHENHLALLASMMRDDIHKRIQDCVSMRGVYEVLSRYPSLGPFLAFQYAIDINYSPVIDFSEMSFVVAGPGAIGGIQKCFTSTGELTSEQIIAWVAERQTAEFERRGLQFEQLGKRALQLIDCQNLFCEIDKYARVAHPEHTTRSRRVRMKRRFRSDRAIDGLWFPPKWKVNEQLNDDVLAQK